MRKEITRLLEFIRYSDPELPEISLGMLMLVTAAAPDRLVWMPPAAQLVLAGAGLLRIFASISCSLPTRHAFNLACVILFSVMMGVEIYHPGTGDELFLFSVTAVSIWCLYRTSYEINSRIDINKGK